MPRVKYIGDKPELKGATGFACNNQPKWLIRVDRPDTPINPKDHPIYFGRHWFPLEDWEEVK